MYMEVFMVIISVLVIGICISFGIVVKWNEIRYSRRKGLPPGTMGWPLFGETTDFLKLGPEFMKKQKARYGSVFKSHLLGCPTIVSMDPELNRYILLNEARGLIPGYPKSSLDILGECNISAVYGSTHKRIRGSFLSLVGPPMIKDQLLSKVDKFMRIHLHNWDGKTVDIQEKTNQMALFIAFKQVMEKEPSWIYEAFKLEFEKLLVGSLSLPINILGTNYHKGFQGRKKIISLLRQIIEKRRASSEANDDMLHYLLRTVDNKYELSDDEIFDQVITIMYSGYETVSTTSMMAIKYLHDHPKVLEEIRNEHFKIREKQQPGEQITWDDYKSMTFTRAVIFETLRLATVVNGVLRKTNEEMELQGYCIPKGWRIYVYTREINYDPCLYPDPSSFNPWRWMAQDKSMESHNYFFLFGGGTRLCPGKELGIVMISTFLHYFVTSYSWEEVGGEKIIEFPRVEAPKGFHIRVFNYKSN